MKQIIFILTIILSLTNCSSDNSSIKVKENCKCCTQTYTNVESALNCAEASNKLLLIVLVDTESNIGWKILKDQDIIDKAKQDYVLLTITKDQGSFDEKNSTMELVALINENNPKPFFIITNVKFYPFGRWTVNEDKDEILNKLNIGVGP